MSLSKHHVRNTALRPLVYAWDELYQEQQDTLKRMKKQQSSSMFRVQYQGPDTNWQSVDGFQDFHDLALFPASGNIGMVVRSSFLNTNDSDIDNDGDANNNNNTKTI
ncbi:MAG: hypothetical protein SGARI_000025, partial [Bacillariaceae sp.]